MNKKYISLPIILLVTLMLAGFGSAFNGTPAIGSCTLNSVTASNTTSGSSTNTIGCTVSNATLVNFYWKTTTAIPLTTSEITATDYSCDGVTLTTSNATPVTVSCTVNNVGDEAARWYFDAVNTTAPTAVSDAFSVSLEGESEEQEEADDAVTTVVETASNNKMLIIGGIVLVVALIASFSVMTSKKK